MHAPTETPLCAELARLRVELIELAFRLDARGSHEAADVAMTTSARLDELCAASVPSASVPTGRDLRSLQNPDHPLPV